MNSQNIQEYSNFEPIECNGEFFYRPDKKQPVENLFRNGKDDANNREIFLDIEYGSNKWIELACDLATKSVNSGGVFTSSLLLG